MYFILKSVILQYSILSSWYFFLSAVGTVKDYHSVGMSIMNMWTVFNNVLCIWIGRLTIVVVQASCCVAHNTLIDDLSFRSFAYIK